MGNTRLDLEDTQELELEETRLNIEDPRENELRDKKLNLEDTRETELGDKRIDIDKPEIESLSNKILSIKNPKNISSLGNKIVRSEKNKHGEPEEIYDSFIGIIESETKEPEELGEKRLDLEDSRENELGDKRLDIRNTQEPEELGDKRIDIEDTQEPEELGDKRSEKPENKNEEIKDLGDKRVDIIGEDIPNPESLLKKIQDLPNHQESIYLEEIIREMERLNKKNDELRRAVLSRLSDDDLYNLAMKIAMQGEKAQGPDSGWYSKISSLTSAYLSYTKITPKRAIEFREAINNTLKSGYFGAKTALRTPIDTSSGTTWAKAEEAIGPDIVGTTRKDALEETIVRMVRYSRSNLPSIPGSFGSFAELGSNVANNATGLITGKTNHPNPINKPFSAGGSILPGGPGDTSYIAANNRVNLNSTDILGDTMGTAFYARYWSAPSFKQTLKDLCPITGGLPIASLFQLKETLNSSPYITTPGKFMTSSKGQYNTFSLDTNMYWEVTIEPYCCIGTGNSVTMVGSVLKNSGEDLYGNGGWSYLPSIDEINVENKKDHKIATNYGLWAPISSFELQKSKLSTKSLQLYDGEIVYPTGMEFTNELRLSFVDDNWKSWRRYFEKCAEVAIYNSEPHDYKYYTKKDVIPTAVDKTNICIALYKNITFMIGIYILNPQYNLLKKYGLLCVLKDFSEEYVGEVDSGGTDLNVSFSIVGENCDYISGEGNNIKKAKTATIKSLVTTAVKTTQNIVQKSLSDSVSLL